MQTCSPMKILKMKVKFDMSISPNKYGGVLETFGVGYYLFLRPT